MNLHIIPLFAVLAATCFGFAIADDPSYDPLSIATPRKAETVDFVVTDTLRPTVLEHWALSNLFKYS